MKTVHVAIGNSDNQLSQEEWSLYCKQIDDTIRNYAMTVHGYWHSLPDSKYQNACWAFDVNPDHIAHAGVTSQIKYWLGQVALKFRQESIAWNESETEFVKAGTAWDR